MKLVLGDRIAAGNRAGSWNLNSVDEWIADLTAAMLAASRRQDEQATGPASPPGVQGQGDLGCRKGEKALAELAQQYDVHPNPINQWWARQTCSARSRPRLSRRST